MALEQELIVRLEAGVLWLTLNRPDRRNALSPALYEALRDALEAAGRDPAVGAVVLAGAGGAFCAGGDMDRMRRQAESAPPSPAQRIAAMRGRTRIVEYLHGMPKPAIAMIRGAAVGAGLSLALACDLRYGDASARLRTGFIGAGVPGDFGGHYFLPRIVGLQTALVESPVVGVCALLGAGITAFYMTRLMLMTFFTNKRWADDVHPHESPKVMTVPLIVLAALSVLGCSTAIARDVHRIDAP